MKESNFHACKGTDQHANIHLLIKRGNKKSSTMIARQVRTNLSGCFKNTCILILT